MLLARSLFARAAQLLLGAVFLVAAASKGMDIVRFARQIESLAWSAGLPDTQSTAILATVAAVIIIIIELTIGVLLVSNWRSYQATTASLVILMIFILVTAWAIVKGSGADCGCFGTLLPRSGKEALLDDFLLAALALLALKRKPSEHSNPKTAGVMYIAGIVWCLGFFTFPASGAALRTGVHFQLPDSLAAVADGRQAFVWFFNPDCERCQKQLPNLTAFVEKDSKLIGITSASRGRIEEFKLDFAPGVPILQAGDQDYKRYGVHDGTLIEVKAGKIIRLWQGYQIAANRTPNLSKL